MMSTTSTLRRLKQDIALDVLKQSLETLEMIFPIINVAIDTI